MTSLKNKRTAELFKLLASDTRVAILDVVARNKYVSVKTIAKVIGQSQSATSHQLCMLRDAGILKVQDQGRHRFYSLRETDSAQLLARLVRQG